MLLLVGRSRVRGEREFVVRCDSNRTGSLPSWVRVIEARCSCWTRVVKASCAHSMLGVGECLCDCQRTRQHWRSLLRLEHHPRGSSQICDVCAFEIV